MGFGDCSQGSYHMKCHEPVKGVGWRKVFQRAGYEAVLIDEWGTSKYCSACCSKDAICEKYKEAATQGRSTCNAQLQPDDTAGSSPPR